MDIQGTYTLPASPTEVWHYLLDTQLLQLTVPGIEHLEQVSEHTYAIAVNIKHVEEYRKRQTKRYEECKAIQRNLRSQDPGNLAVPYWLMTVNYGVRIAQARLDWCDDTLAALNKMSKANPKKK